MRFGIRNSFIHHQATKTMNNKVKGKINKQRRAQNSRDYFKGISYRLRFSIACIGVEIIPAP